MVFSFSFVRNVCGCVERHGFLWKEGRKGYSGICVMSIRRIAM